MKKADILTAWGKVVEVINGANIFSDKRQAAEQAAGVLRETALKACEDKAPESITTLEQLAVDHPYYCHTNNYYSNEAAAEFDTWAEFYEDWGDANNDWNLFFRWDVKKYDPEEQEEGEERSGFYMELFVMGQRKGLFIPVTVHSIQEEDLPQILEFLRPRMDYLLKLWAPLL